MSEPVVHIVDDDESVRKSLRWLIESVGLKVNCYDSASTFTNTIIEEGPGCMVLDVRMPGMSGLDLQEQLAHTNLPLPVIIVTGHADVPMAIRALKSGAFDFIEKPYNDQHLLDRVQDAISYSTRSISAVAEKQEARNRINSLTRREREVMSLVTEGCANKQIATQLNLSIKTVETHRANLMSKMQAGSLPALIKLVMLAQEN
jgi:FixJ family two-component response regulator